MPAQNLLSVQGLGTSENFVAKAVTLCDIMLTGTHIAAEVSHRLHQTQKCIPSTFFLWHKEAQRCPCCVLRCYAKLVRVWCVLLTGPTKICLKSYTRRLSCNMTKIFGSCEFLQYKIESETFEHYSKIAQIACFLASSPAAGPYFQVACRLLYLSSSRKTAGKSLLFVRAFRLILLR